jgi:hypothetical protein
MFLYLHWRAMNEAMKNLGKNEDSAELVNQESESVPEYVRNIQDEVDKFKWLAANIRRVEAYLGKEYTAHKPTSQMIEDARFIAASKGVRALIQSGESDESVAALLKDSFSSAPHHPDQKSGRPVGSLACDECAVNALELHDSYPNEWTWPKLADELMECKHTTHAWDSDCTARLKKSVERLRKYLVGLGYYAAVK